MVDAEAQIQRMVNLETSAWNDRDANALVDLFHPDAVWPWPPDSNSHDPETWVNRAYRSFGGARRGFRGC
jgi:hypothetical protein